MLDRIRLQLIELARQKKTLPYSTLKDQFELGLDFSLARDRKAIGDMLEEISLHENSMERPLISVFIVHLKDGDQGEGFYKMCSQLNGRDWQALRRDKVWEESIKTQCQVFWSNPENYKRFRYDY